MCVTTAARAAFHSPAECCVALLGALNRLLEGADNVAQVAAAGGVAAVVACARAFPSEGALKASAIACLCLLATSHSAGQEVAALSLQVLLDAYFDVNMEPEARPRWQRAHSI